MSKQVASTILMIRPVSFRLNEETAVNNYYQGVIDGLTMENAQKQALQEFDAMVENLRTHDIKVIVVEDTLDPETPDAIFPNNWISFHHDGSIAIYPMFAENRRLERRDDIPKILSEQGYEIDRIVDFIEFEKQQKYLEGTGSMLLDRDNHIVYAALSDRTHKDVLASFCEAFSYQAVTFHANQTVNGKRLPIYHTNVMMCLTDTMSIVCLDSIDDVGERLALVDSLSKTNKQIIDITEEQVNHFAGNMLALANAAGDSFIIMSAAAVQSLSEKQKQDIETYYTIISSPLDTIEALGGGSARCMMAEVFLPKER